MLTALVLCALPQTTWFVDVNGAPPGSGTIDDPYTSVAYAVAQPTTVPGDHVFVYPGVYLDEEVDFGGKDLSLTSAGGAGVTELVAPPWPGSGPRPSLIHLTGGETRATLIEGFTLTGGLGASDTIWGPAGGGINCIGSGATVRGCVFRDQKSAAGAGIYSVDGDLVLESCIFTKENILDVAIKGDGAFILGGQATFWKCSFLELLDWHDWLGGGALVVENASLTVEGCTFDRNLNHHVAGNHLRMVDTAAVVRDSTFDRGHTGHGASIAAEYGTLVLDNCDVTDNWAYQHDGSGLTAFGTELYVYRSRFRDNQAFGGSFGGGLYLESGNATVVDSTFEGNEAMHGAGLAFRSTDAVVHGCKFITNVSVDCQTVCFGGGIFADGGTLAVDRCVFDRNEAHTDVTPGHGGGIYGHVGMSIDHCTFVGNRAGGEGKAISGGVITNSIVVGSLPDPIEIAVAFYSLIEGGYDVGDENFDGDPSFWSDQDVHLLPDSDAIDTGDPAAPLDADGSRSDVGAYAFDPWHCGDGCTGAVGEPTCAALPNSTGLPATLHGVGSTAVATNRVVLNTTDLPRNTLGFLLASQSTDFVVHFGGSEGILCVGTPILRFTETVSSSGALGRMSFRADLWAFPQEVFVLPGDTWYFQTWYRDTVGGFETSNTAQALRVRFE